MRKQSLIAIAALALFIAVGVSLQLTPATASREPSEIAEAPAAAAIENGAATPAMPREFHALTADGLRR
jgi:hypothetical protein